MHEFPSAAELQGHYARGELSPVEVFRATLQRIRDTGHLNAFQFVDEHAGELAARESEARWRRRSPLGELDGVPIPVKDLVDVRGLPTRNGSLTGSPLPAEQDAPCVARLREAGAVLFAKTSTPEFGWKGITDSLLAGATRNPWDNSLSCGGSSGGAAVAVATGACALAHGNDGGGSIRIPASYCGVYGIKPTFGRVPDYPRAGAYDTLAAEGPLSRRVIDAAMFLDCVSKPDHRDWYAVPACDGDYRRCATEGEVTGLRIAVCVSPGGVAPAAFIAEAIRAAAGELEREGAIVEELDSVFEQLRPVFERFWLGGLFARVDAVDPELRHLVDADLRRVAAAGEDVSLREFADATTQRAQLAARMGELHQRYDLLLTPTMPTDPPPVTTQYHSDSFDRWQHATPYTVPFNLTGQPAASIPCGRSPSGLPIGLQIVAGRFREDLVLRASAVWERLHPVVRCG